MKIKSKLLILYLVGGLLPLLIFGFVLIRSWERSFITQAKENDASNVMTAEQRMSEFMNSVTMASRYFIFDPELEHLATHEYQSYVELANDYNQYKNFSKYGSLYSDQVNSFSMYFNNPTIRSNADFVYADEKVRAEDWYQTVFSDGAIIHWLIVPRLPSGEESLALTRKISLRSGRLLGVLVIHIREAQIEEILDSLNGSSFLIDENGKLLISGTKGAPGFAQLRDALAEEELAHIKEKHALPSGAYQLTVEIGAEEYLMTGMQLRSEKYPLSQNLDIVTLHPYKTILDETNRQSRNYYIILTASAVLSFGLIAFFSSGFSNRIRRFRTAIEQTAEGEYGFRHKLKGNDEISELYNHLGNIIHRMQTMNQQIQEERLKSEKLRTAQREAELKMLTMQINPHFLYNTLETIRMKARIEKEYEIEDIVKRLAKLLRYTLEVGDKDVPLRRETEAVEAYLHIQEHRLGNRFESEIILPEELAGCPVMPLLIQPLAENAMIHALEGKSGHGRLLIKAERQADDLHILVADNGPGIPAAKLKQLQQALNEQAEDGVHIGLRNVHQRLVLRYGEAYGLRIESTEGKGCRMHLTMPFAEQNNEEER